jgi:hypothetical protein
MYETTTLKFSYFIAFLQVCRRRRRHSPTNTYYYHQHLF